MKAIIDTGPPEIGLKAECRQFAVQTHHIDPLHQELGDLLDSITSPKNFVSLQL